MSETRQSRKLLRESLVQHTFHYFDELKKTNSESDARSFVLKEIAELQTLFSKEETQVSFLSALKEKEKYWQNKSKSAEKEKDIDGALYANEILGAINLLRQAIQEE